MFENLRFSQLEKYDAAWSLWHECGIFVDAVESARELGWISYFRQFPDRFLVFYDQSSNVVATCVLFYDGRKAGIYRLAVRPNYQGSGIGQALINLAESKAKADGMSGIYALVDNKAKASQALFHKNGFTKIPEIRYFTKSI